MRSPFVLRVAGAVPRPVKELGKDALLRWPKPRWGNLRRREPFSARAGFDRGTPVDRFYLDRFLERYAGEVRGRVLEVRDARYTTRFGGSDVDESVILDINATNPSATLVADIGERNSLPAASFDCILLTQVLQLVPDVDVALANVAQALRAGGTALIAVETITGAALHEGVDDLWRWTPAGLSVALARGAPGLDATVEGFGTLTAAIAFLHGLAAEELGDRDLWPTDARYVIVTCARLHKPRA